MEIRRCSACGARLSPSPISKIVICHYCGSTFSPLLNLAEGSQGDGTAKLSICECGSALYSSCSICSVGLCEKCTLRASHFDIKSIIKNSFNRINQQQLSILYNKFFTEINMSASLCAPCFDKSLTGWLSSLTK